jgi:hypothetical protein
MGPSESSKTSCPPGPMICKFCSVSMMRRSSRNDTNRIVGTEDERSTTGSKSLATLIDEPAVYTVRRVVRVRSHSASMRSTEVLPSRATNADVVGAARAGAALVPASESVEVASVGEDNRGLNSSRSCAASNRGDGGVLKLAVGVNADLLDASPERAEGEVPLSVAGNEKTKGGGQNPVVCNGDFQNVLGVDGVEVVGRGACNY